MDTTAAVQGDGQPDAAGAALENEDEAKAKAAENDPFLTAEGLIKMEENATDVRASFKGPHADVERHVHKTRIETNKETFGGADEAEQKVKRIKKDAEWLKKTMADEAKMLGIEVPKPGAKAKAKKKKSVQYIEEEEDVEDEQQLGDEGFFAPGMVLAAAQCE